jgi:23S rRNA (uracil1939-C5)-methyltransferase
MLQTGAELVLTIEKPAAGGRMIARHDGRIVLVGGTLPGEVVRARIERVGRGVVYAATAEVLEPSPDRRSTAADPACGGNVYAHVAYERQLALKREVIADAFLRIARLPLAFAVPVAPSPEQGYRMRARLHVRAGAIGFFREGTHDLCDPAVSGQLLPQTSDLLARLSVRMRGEGVGAVSSVELAENIAGSERALHLELARAVERGTLEGLFRDLAVTGVSASGASDRDAETVMGTPFVSDAIDVERSDNAAATVTLRRHARAFFQANRFLLPHLAARVRALVPPGPVLDLYAGVGLFAVTLAAAGVGEVSAVEGDRVSAVDLKENAKPFGHALRTFVMPVERFLEGRQAHAQGTLILDPPRTGMSRAAAAGVLGLGVPRIVFVSCDVATLARDVRRLVDAGYELVSIDAFDLFPNTAHVEAVAVLVTSPAGTPG